MSETRQPVFSIITPTCRRPQLLERTINSVIRQTFNDYEHIIIDDANDTGTESLVNKFKDKRIVFRQNRNSKGAAGSYNTGIEIARGRLILFLDDDDEYLPSFLEKMHTHFCRAGKNIGFIWTGISRIEDTESGDIVISSMIWPSTFPAREQALIEATSIGNGFGVCIRKECIDIIGLYDESLIMGQDTDFLFRLAGRFDFETLPEVLVRIHQHGSSQLTNEKNNLARLEFKEKILKKHDDLLKIFPKLYYVHYKPVVNLCYNLKLKRKGRKNMLSIIKNSRFNILNFTDLFFYELLGKDTVTFYYESRLRKIVHFLKRAQLNKSAKKVTFKSARQNEG